MKVLMFAASTRKGSINAKLITAVEKRFASAGFDTTVVSLSDYDMPIYNGDWEAENGAPETAKELAALFKSHDAVFIASPEYNGGLPALLKNTIDWLTRLGDMEHYHKPIFTIGSCTPGVMSGIMVMRQIQYILNRLGAELIPVQLGVGSASEAYNEDGSFAREFNINMADKMIGQLKSRLERKG